MPSCSLEARSLVIIGEVSNSCSSSVEAMISPPSVTAYTRTSEGRLFNVSENRVGVIPKKTQDSSAVLEGPEKRKKLRYRGPAFAGLERIVLQREGILSVLSV